MRTPDYMYKYFYDEISRRERYLRPKEGHVVWMDGLRTEVLPYEEAVAKAEALAIKYQTTIEIRLQDKVVGTAIPEAGFAPTEP